MTGIGAARVLLAVLLLLSGCASPIYHWGTYEESLRVRHVDATTEGRQKALVMLRETIDEAERAGRRVPPGVHADYGYLLYRTNRSDDAFPHFRREAELYPEARPLMDSIIVRIKAGTAKP